MYRLFLKRFLDIVISFFAIPFIVIIIIIIGPIIFLTDRGPVFYCGERLGKNGKPFKMIKFRSMRVNAPDLRNPDGSTFNGDNDPRVTKIGKFLRTTSIDELPQFFNVFIGQMSIIGPRPDPLEDLLIYTEEQKRKLTIRPGITGYNQAYFRNSVTQEDKFNHDVYYANNVSFYLDIKIFFKTISTIFKKENVYNEVSKNNKEEKNNRN